MYPISLSTQRAVSDCAPAQRASSLWAGRSVFNLSVSGRPRASEAEGGREKTETRKQRGPGGPELVASAAATISIDPPTIPPMGNE